jgi:CPA1 family monovalent cation:H+ antiporter
VTPFQTLAAVLTVAALFAYVNHRWIRQPPAIALMALSLGSSLLLLLVDQLGLVHVTGVATQILETVDLDDTLLHGVLGVLLFAGALHVNLAELRQQRLAIATLAVGATVLSTLLLGALARLVLAALGTDLSLRYCMLFGALISPTDPIAVMGILKAARVPRSTEIVIAGESLFNDGVGVVVFLTVLEVISGGHASAGHVIELFVREALGGALFGLVIGQVTYRLLRSIDHYQTELLLTLALVVGGYALAEMLHVSAPLAAVVAGLVIGNQGRAHGMSETTRDHLDKFWSLVDDVMNALLFVLMGFEVIRVSMTGRVLLAGVMMIPVVLIARLISVVVPVAALNRLVRQVPGSVPILTWGGLRGGISVALALSIPPGPNRDLIVSMTYVVVVFSVFVQGLTLGRVARRWADREQS